MKSQNITQLIKFGYFECISENRNFIFTKIKESVNDIIDFFQVLLTTYFKLL